MKSSKNQLLTQVQTIGNVGLPINNTPIYVPSSVFLTNGLTQTTLYGWVNGQPVLGAKALTKNGTINQAVDHSGLTTECEFTGAGYYSSADAAFAFTGTFSVGFWMYRKDWAKPFSTQTDPTVLSRAPVGGATGFIINFPNSTQQLRFYCNGSPTGSTETGHLSSGFHFIQFVRDVANTLTKTYIDGVRVGTTSTVGTITAGGNFEIGSYGGGTYKATEARYSEVWIHNATAWTDTQVKAIYDATAPAHQHTQAFAGHRVQVTEPNTTAAETLALYQFNNASDLTIDAKGTYPLTVVGTPTQAESIFGDMGAVRTSSGNCLTNATLLSTAPSKGIWVSFWAKPELNDSNYQDMFVKHFATSHYITVIKNTTGSYSCNVGNGADYSITTMSPVRVGRWEKFDFCWDLTNGVRFFVNGVLEGQKQIDYPLFNATYPLQIGRYYNGTPNYYFTGSFCDFKVLDKVATQNDIDVAYASVFTKPTILRQVDMVINPLGDTTKQRRERIAIVNSDSTLAYRQGMSQVYGNYLPQGDTEKQFFIEAAGNAGQSVTTAQDIPFIATTQNNLTWDGSGFTAPISGNYEVFGSVHLGTAIEFVQGYVNNILVRDNMGSRIVAGVTGSFLFSGKVYLAAGQRFSLRFANASQTLINTPTRHYLSITRLNGLGSQPLVNNADTIQLRSGV